MKSPGEAIEIQKRLSSKIKLVYDGPKPEELKLVGGCDVSYEKERDEMIGAFVVMSFPSLRVVEVGYHRMKVGFPYIPGLLSFREIPVLLEAYRKLRTKPEVIFVDGQGIAHPRGIGLASHLGLELNAITIGVAKSKLIGDFDERSLGRRKGSKVPLMIGEKKVGYVVRTRDGVNPVFVSPGHRIDTETAAHLTLLVTRSYRIPEPTRVAHMEVTRLKKKFT